MAEPGRKGGRHRAEGATPDPFVQQAFAGRPRGRPFSGWGAGSKTRQKPLLSGKQLTFSCPWRGLGREVQGQWLRVSLDREQCLGTEKIRTSSRSHNVDLLVKQPWKTH